jgi:hypothetical protein
MYIYIHMYIYIKPPGNHNHSHSSSSRDIISGGEEMPALERAVRIPHIRPEIYPDLTNTDIRDMDTDSDIRIPDADPELEAAILMSLEVFICMYIHTYVYRHLCIYM